VSLDDTFVRVCPASEVPRATIKAAEVNDTPIVVVHAEDDNFYAAYDECSHAQVPLSEGEVEGCTLECWLHGSRFDLRTGMPSGPPATESVPVYPTEIVDGDVYVSLVPSNGVNP
jgi:3-phenylpropionate/trans-cinnamate dioxygenase ferredoxin subunit